MGHSLCDAAGIVVQIVYTFPHARLDSFWRLVAGTNTAVLDDWIRDAELRHPRNAENRQQDLVTSPDALERLWDGAFYDKPLVELNPLVDFLLALLR